MNQSTTVLENLSASQLRVVLTSPHGIDTCTCTLGTFCHHNRAELPRSWRRNGPRMLANQIRAFGRTNINLGSGGIFTLRAE